MLRISYLSRFTCQRRAAMNLEGTEDSASRFAAYVGELTSVIGHADRARPLRDYCAGLVVTEGRRSVEPIAAVTAPKEAPVQHQRLLHFVAEAPWSDEPVLVKVRVQVGRRAASVLRAAWQASQLSGGSDVVDRQSSCQPADRVQALSAGGMGKRRGPPQESTCSQGDHVQD